MIVWSAALLLASCSSAKAEDSLTLLPLESNEDNGLISQVQSRNPGSLCGLIINGSARLMSFGQQAVVDIDGKPAVLSYHPARMGMRLDSLERPLAFLDL